MTTKSRFELFIEAAEALIDSVEFDVSGKHGKGGHGGLVSIDTLKAVNALRVKCFEARRSLKRGSST
jgi:hypothetical protein